jgi:hypothetical protein
MHNVCFVREWIVLCATVKALPQFLLILSATAQELSIENRKTMSSLRLYKSYHRSPCLPNVHRKMVKQNTFSPNKLVHRRKLAVRGCSGQESEKKTGSLSFLLTLEEAGRSSWNIRLKHPWKALMPFNDNIIP